MKFSEILRQLAQRERSVEQLRDLQAQVFSNRRDLAAVFPDHFLLHRQADFEGVGGDFCAVAMVDGFCMLAVVDSIGHSLEGVAGSLAIHLMLMDAWHQGKTDPALAIQHMHAMAGRYFSHNITCDLGISRYHAHSRTLDYAGAKRRAHTVTGAGALIVINASRISVGQERGEIDAVVCHRSIMHPRTRLFMATDGIESQPGGAQGKALGSVGLRRWLRDTSVLPLSAQAGAIEGLWSDWIDGRSQTDDVLMVGVEF